MARGHFRRQRKRLFNPRRGLHVTHYRDGDEGTLLVEIGISKDWISLNGTLQTTERSIRMIRLCEDWTL